MASNGHDKQSARDHPQAGIAPTANTCGLCQKTCEPIQASCGHHFCNACLENIVRPSKKTECRICQAEVETSENTQQSGDESEYDARQAANETESRALLDLWVQLMEHPTSLVTCLNRVALNIRLEQQVTNMLAEQAERQIQAFHQQMLLLNNSAGIIAALSSEVQHCKTRIQAVLAEMEAIKQRDAATSQKLQSLQREEKKKDAAINKMLSTVKILEINTSYDGTLMLKISDYSKKLQSAINGKDVGLYSPPFHTSRYGYKMRALVYLNGNGIGKETHVSLYFMILRGEYDAIQKWPFQQRVSFYLVNQKSGVHDIVKNSFQPDPTNAAFQRPGSEMNAMIGYPKFIRKELVYDEFVRDDTMFIKICVDMTNLSTIPL